MPTHTDLTKRFLDQANSLIRQGVVANFSQLADAIDWDRTSMTSVRKGRRQIPQAVYRKFTEVYKIAPEPEPAIGSTPRDQKIIDLLESQVELLKHQVSSATGELRHIAVMNFSMLKSLQQISAQLLAKAEKADIMTITGKIDRETAKFYRSVRDRGSLIDEGM